MKKPSNDSVFDPHILQTALHDNPWASVLGASSGDIRRLASVWRYSSVPITIPENVADHSFWVSVYAVMIHQELLRQSSSVVRRQYGKQSVLLAVLLRAVTHDLGEAVTGDIVRPFKYSSDSLKQAVDQAEESMVEKLFPQAVKEVFELTEEAMANTGVGTYANAVVKAADFMSLYQFMRREVLRGNCEVKGFVEIMVDDFHRACAGPPHVHSFPFNILSSYYRCLEKAAVSLFVVADKARGGVV